MNLQYDPKTDTDYFRDEQGHEYRTGLIASPPMASANVFADRFETMPRSEWKDVGLWHLDPSIWNQNPFNSCAGHGAVAAFSLAYHAGGAKPMRFSPTYVYGNIIADQRRGDNGARLNETLNEVTNRGVSPESLVGPGAIYRAQWSKRADADAAAAIYKGAEWIQVRTFDEMVTAHQLGFATSFGISLGQSFSPAQGGFIPARRGGGGGHAMASGGHAYLNGQWWLRVKNSWGTGWGDGGYCWMPESYFTPGDIEAYGGAWAIRVATSNPADDMKVAA